MSAEIQVDVAVLGSGPGGYSAAFRAADLGRRVALIERYPALGGVCLNVGCIPSKTLLHMAAVVQAARELGAHGIRFSEPKFDVDRIRARKNAVVETLTGGLAKLAKQRQVTVVTGVGRFATPKRIDVATPDGVTRVAFEHAIVATGSRSTRLPGLPYEDPRVMDSTASLELEALPRRLLVIGGGIIGLEMACVYEALGAHITVVEALDSLMAGVDADIVRPLQRRIAKRYAGILLETTVSKIQPRSAGLLVAFEGKNAIEPEIFDRVLVAVGRTPNGDAIGAERAGLSVDERGFLPADDRQRTNVPHIFAIGDVVGPPLLAHKATHQGKVAAEVIAGLPAAFDAAAVPSVAYTDPEVAWMGLSETEAREQGIEIEKAVYPWAASGRALSIGRTEGLTKLLFSKQDRRLVGAGITGPGAGELIAETVLALELGADAEDIARSIHAHPTLSETVAFAAEMAEGTITDLYAPRKRK